MITDITFNGQSASDLGLICLQEGDSEDVNEQVGGTYEIKKDAIPSKKSFYLYESNITEPTTFDLSMSGEFRKFLNTLITLIIPKYQQLLNSRFRHFHISVLLFIILLS